MRTKYILAADDCPWTHGDSRIAAEEGEPFGNVEILADIRDANGELVALVPVDDVDLPGKIAGMLNSHAALLEACEFVENAPEPHDKGFAEWFAQWQDAARAAIALAEGQDGDA